MKLPELKEKLKSKYIVRVVAGVLTIALVGTGIGATAVFAEKNDTAVTSEAASDSSSTDDIADDLMNSISLKDEDADKDESVYLISDANGNVDKTIVVDHLKNKDKKDTLEDVSNLSDIENVKGKETFEQNGDKLTWQAGGNDIYYQGTASEEPPVTQKVTYYLDGKEISPEDLAGKSGKVKIRFDYTNTTSFTETVNGEKQTVSVPFAAITGLVLGDGFSNVEVTNGKVQANDSSNIVIGYALPGLKDSLGIKDEDLDDDVNIPEYMEVSADVEDFSLSTAMTFVVNASDYVSSDGIDTSSLDDMINDLTDATTQLKDGSADLASGADTLANGVGTLKDSLGTFAAGMNSLQSGLKSYTDGASQLNAGINTLGNSTGSLVDGAGQLNSGAAQLASGSADLKTGVKKYTDGASKIATGASALDEGVGTLAEKSGALVDGAKQLDDGAEVLEKGAKDLSDGMDKLNTGIQAANVGAANLASGADRLKAGADQLNASVNGVVDENGNKISGDVVDTLSTEMKDQIQAMLDSQFNKNEAIKPILQYLGVDKITVDNVSEVTEKVVNQHDVLVQIMSGEENYNNLLSGLYQMQGAVTLYTKFSSGLQSNEQIKALKDGVSSLSTGINGIESGSNDLAEGTKQLAANAPTLKNGVGSLQNGIGTLKDGTSSLVNQVPSLTGGIKQIKDGSSQLNAGAKDLTSNNDELNAGATALNSGANQLSAGTQSLVDKIPALTSGIKQLVDGSNTLVSNNNALLSGASQLSDGTTQIVSGVDQLADGSKTLADGAHTLADGIVQFNEEGINKILDAYNGDLKPLTNKLQAVIDAGEDYQTYSAIADGQTGSVKFIYKLASIESDSDK
ncbi:hypothetical protein [Agathobacter sp.]